MFTKARDWGKAYENPVKHVRFFKEKNIPLQFLEVEEIRALLNASPDYFRPILIMALNTGMRRGEIFNLKWDDIDFKRGLIMVRDSKNNEAREIPMNRILHDTLKAHKKNPNSELVFCHSDGRKLINLRDILRKSLRKAKIEKQIRFHDLRHTFASQLVMSGADLIVVKELLGHKTLNMTARYAHLSPRYKVGMLDILGSKMDTIWTPEGSLKTEVLKNPEK